MAAQLNGISFQRVGRESNKVAHNLVGHVYHVTNFNVWMEDVSIHYFDVYQAIMPLS